MTEHTSTTRLSELVDAFRLAYDVHDGPPERTVVLLQGWPGDRRDFRDVVRGLVGQARCVTPDLRGFGGSGRHDEPPAAAYGGPAQARSVLGLLDELGIETATFVGYDIGSRTAQIIARADRLEDYFSDVQLRPLLGIGHFSPLEAPKESVAAIMSQPASAGS